MSAKKVFETKIRDDENTDSGFLSGPIARYPDEEDPTEEPESGDQTVQRDCLVQSDSCKENVGVDSGLDLCLSECLDSLRVETEPATVLPTFKLTPDIPPLAILFQQDDDGDTQLHIASVHGCEKSVSTLIRVCPEKYLLDLPNDFGHTALHLAVLSRHAVVARMLVRAGASVAVRDLNGDTPLHLATSASNVECLQALLAPTESQSSLKKLAPVLNLKNYDGQTCLHLAATSGHKQTLQTLLYYGADVNAREGLAGWTALHIAARRGDARLAQQLSQWPSAAPRARDFAGRTARRLARRLAPQADQARLLAALPEDSDDSDDDTDEEGESPAKRSRSEMGEGAVAGPSGVSGAPHSEPAARGDT